MGLSHKEFNMTVWPFPPPSGPVPWTPAQERAYQQKLRDKTGDAPFLSWVQS